MMATAARPFLTQRRPLASSLTILMGLALAGCTHGFYPPAIAQPPERAGDKPAIRSGPSIRDASPPTFEIGEPRPEEAAPEEVALRGAANRGYSKGDW
jgi:hypothetical protein